MTRIAVVLVEVAEAGPALIRHFDLLATDEPAPQLGPDPELEAAGQTRVVLELADDEAIARLSSGDWGVDVAARQLVELPFKAMLLGADGVLEEVVELAGSHALTAQHVDLRPYGGDCDREPGKYRWDAESAQLIPLGKHAQRAGGGVDLERALYDFWAQLAAAGNALPKTTAAWCAQYEASVDNKKSKGA